MPYKSPPKTPKNQPKSNSENCEHSEHGETEWKTPSAFGRQTGPEFPVNALPPVLANYVTELATFTQTPTDLAGCMVLVIIATASQKVYVVRPLPGWDEPVNLYVLGTLPPANRKSAVVTAVKMPLSLHEREQAIRMAPVIRAARTRFDILTKQRNDYVNAVSKTESAEREHLFRQIAEIDDELAANQVPSEPRWIVTDITPEHLATKLAQNHGRISVVDAEGDFLDIIGGRYSKGQPNLGLLLKAHSGDDHRVDRGNRPSEDIRKPAISLGLLVQDDVFLGMTDHRSFRGRGLLGRFLYTKPESWLGHRDIDAPSMTLAVEQNYNDLITKILNLPVGFDDAGEFIPQALLLSAGAATTFRQFRATIENDLAEFGRLANLLDWGGKIAGQTARIAGLLHIAGCLADGKQVAEKISQETMTNAIRLGEYFIGHAVVMFSLMGMDVSTSDAKRLWKAIQKYEFKTFTKRDLHQKVKGTFIKPDDIDNPLRLLESHGYIADITPPYTGKPGRRPSRLFAVNPLADVDAHNSQNAQNGEAA